MAGAAIAPNLAVALVLWFVVGAATMTLMSTSNTTLQLTSRPDMRGRVISLYMLLVMGTTPVGGPIVGWVAQRAGTRWAIALGAAASLCGAAIAARGGRHHGHPPTAHDDERLETSQAVRPAAATAPASIP
jgi:MFS family permease